MWGWPDGEFESYVHKRMADEGLDKDIAVWGELGRRQETGEVECPLNWSPLMKI